MQHSKHRRQLPKKLIESYDSLLTSLHPATFPIHSEAAKIIVRAAHATEMGALTILNELEADKRFHSSSNHDDSEIRFSDINKIIETNAKIILDNCGHTADAVSGIINCLPKDTSC